MSAARMDEAIVRSGKFHNAVYRGKTNELNQLRSFDLTKDAAVVRAGRFALQGAVSREDQALVDALLASGADTGATAKEKPALVRAVEAGNRVLVKSFLTGAPWPANKRYSLKSWALLGSLIT